MLMISFGYGEGDCTHSSCDMLVKTKQKEADKMAADTEEEEGGNMSMTI